MFLRYPFQIEVAIKREGVADGCLEDGALSSVVDDGRFRKRRWFRSSPY